MTKTKTKPMKPMIPPKGTKKSKTKGACRALTALALAGSLAGCGTFQALVTTHPELAKHAENAVKIASCADLVGPYLVEAQKQGTKIEAFELSDRLIETARCVNHTLMELDLEAATVVTAAPPPVAPPASPVTVILPPAAPVPAPKVADPQSRIDLEPNPYLKTAFAKLPVDREVF